MQVSCSRTPKLQEYYGAFLAQKRIKPVQNERKPASAEVIFRPQFSIVGNRGYDRFGRKWEFVRHLNLRILENTGSWSKSSKVAAP